MRHTPRTTSQARSPPSGNTRSVVTSSSSLPSADRFLRLSVAMVLSETILPEVWFSGDFSLVGSLKGIGKSI